MPRESFEHYSAENTEKNTQKPSPDEKTHQQSPKNTAKLQQVRSDYLAHEREAESIRIENDIEYKTQNSSNNTIGYIPYLEALLREVADGDEWLGDSADETSKEQAILQNTALSIKENLRGLAKELENPETQNTRSHEQLRQLYVDRSSRLTELLGSVDTATENVELRNATLAVEQAQETIKHMTTEEAVDWTKRTMSMIDMNNWQSNGLKTTYAHLTQALKQSVQVKLASDKQSLLHDPTKATDYYRHSMEMARLFTDRGSPIDGDLTDIDFAVDMAKEAMQFPELAIQYVEQSVQQKNPLQEYIAGKQDSVRQKITELPSETQKNPQVQEMMRKVEASPSTIQGLTEQYAIIRNLEVMLEGGAAVNIEQELNEKFSPYLESAFEKFETFLDGTLGGAASLAEIQQALGPRGLSTQQIEAWELLADIQGYGYDVGDKTWSYIGAGAKITAMIAAGVAVGFATGGLGIVGAALAGGATMTATNAAINQQGFDDVSDAANVYGKDLAVNTATMGAARYLAAGRAAYQLGRSGLLAEAGGTKALFRIATQKGGLKIVNSFDDASHIGTRLTGATLEGGVDTVIGTTLDTAVHGGEFLDNLQNNAMFMGFGYAEFSGPAMRALRNLPEENLHGIAQTVQSATTQRTKLNGLCRGLNVDPRALVQSSDPKSLLGNLSQTDMDSVLEHVENLHILKKKFKQSMDSLSTEKILQNKGVLEAGVTLDESQHAAIEKAHLVGEGEPGLDGTPACKGNYTVDQLHRKAVILQNAGITKEQRRVLMEAGIVGKPPDVPPKKNQVSPPPIFRMDAEGKLKELEVNGVTMKHGIEVVVTSSGESAIRGANGKAAIIPAGRYILEFKQGANGKEMPTLKPLDPADIDKGNYTINFSKTNIESVTPSSLSRHKPVPVSARPKSKPPPPSPLNKNKVSPSSQPGSISSKPKSKPSLQSSKQLSQQSQSTPSRVSTVSIQPEQKKMLKQACSIANDPDIKMHPDLEAIALDASEHKAVRVETPVDYEDKPGIYYEYNPYGNKAASNEYKGLRMSTSDTGVPHIEAGSVSLNAFLQNYADTPSRAVESVRLGPAQSRNGEKTLYYRYVAENYIAASSNRPGATLSVAVQLDAADAQKTFDLLKSHPKDARAFFVTAGQKVQRSKYLWGERRPNYEETDVNRSMIFVEESDAQSAKPPLDITYLKREKDNTWKQSTLSPEQDRQKSDAINHAEKKKASNVQLARSSEQVDRMLQQRSGKSLQALQNQLRLRMNIMHINALSDALRITGFRKNAKMKNVLREKFQPNHIKAILAYLK